MIGRLLALIAMFCLTPPALAASFGMFYVTERAPSVALMVGDISSQTPLDFRRMINANPQVEVIALMSDGGSIHSGLLLADDIHSSGLGTFIPSGAGCYSACAFIFLAGNSRVANGDLGVHQFYGGEESLASAQYAVSDILEILGKFDVPQQVITRMLRTEPDDMHIFSEEEIVELELNKPSKAIVVAEEQWALGSVEFGPFITAYEDAGRSEQIATGEPQFGISFALYRGVDFYGADVGQLRADDLAQCYTACLENDQCLGITLNTNPRYTTGPNCFLKSGVGRTELYDMAISGLFRFPGETTNIEVNGRHVPATTVIPLD